MSWQVPDDKSPRILCQYSLKTTPLKTTLLIDLHRLYRPWIDFTLSYLATSNLEIGRGRK